MDKTRLPATVTLRPIGPEDLPFLQRLYASTREEELSRVPWAPEQKAAFLEMQFRAQHQYYQQHYGSAAFDVILSAGEPIGRLYVHRTAEDLRIVDISLLPEARGQGIGSAFLSLLQDEARTTRTPLTIHVEKLNPALSLYERMGFRTKEDRGVYWFLEWRAN